MKGVLVIILVVYFFSATGQTKDDLGRLYASHQYQEALEMAKKLLENPNTQADANGVIGRIYVDTKKYREAVPYLQKAIELDNNASYVSGWSHACLGQAYLQLGELEKSRKELEKAIELHATENSTQYARALLDNNFPSKESLQAMQKQFIEAEHGPGFPKWIKKDGNHITYYFQDSKSVSAEVMQNYIRQHESAYDKINNTFKAVLPMKMVFFIWTDGDLAKRLMHNELGFTNPKLCISNTHIMQTIGHEMTHTLWYWGWGESVRNENIFIMEGIGVAFDLAPNDKNEAARKAVAGKNIKTVLDLWRGDHVPAQLVYPVGGAFIKYLFEHSTAQQFKSIVKDESIENAENTYGQLPFYKMIKEFDEMIGLK